LFGDREEITTGVTRFCNLRATKPVDPAQPVMVAATRSALDS
jgi:hypothetical protein